MPDVYDEEGEEMNDYTKEAIKVIIYILIIVIAIAIFFEVYIKQDLGMAHECLRQQGINMTEILKNCSIIGFD